MVSAWDDNAGSGRWLEQGQVEEGIAQMQQGLAAFELSGQRWHGRLVLPCWLKRMGKWGRPQKGLSVLAEALAFVDRTGERVLRDRAVSTKRRAYARPV